jgi:hypothetical protein
MTPPSLGRSIDQAAAKRGICLLERRIEVLFKKGVPTMSARSRGQNIGRCAAAFVRACG